MKKLNFGIIVFCLFMAIPLQGFAQHGKSDDVPYVNVNDLVNYDAYIYCNGNPNVINEKYRQMVSSSDERGVFLSGLVTELGGFAVSNALSLVNSGISYVGKAVKGNKTAWETEFEKENSFTKDIIMQKNINDFYSNVSTKGAFDPSDMVFNGFGMIQTRGNDTVLYMSCHLDTTSTGMNNIIRHSKFTITVDTLIFFPFRCDLPNDHRQFSKKRSTFSFDERSGLTLELDVKVTSSWINKAVQVYNDVEIGRFNISTQIDPKSIVISDDSLTRMNTSCRFVRNGKNNSIDVVNVVGDCFIVPRSYVAVVDDDGDLHDVWGTGQYKVSFTLNEKCVTNPDFAKCRKKWRADWKKMKKQKKENTTVVRKFKQIWDENGSKWVVELLEVPANYSLKTSADKLGLPFKSLSSKNDSQGASGMPK